MVAAARRGRPAWTQATGSSELWDFLFASWLPVPIPGLVLPEWPSGLSTSLPLASASCLYGVKLISKWEIWGLVGSVGSGGEEGPFEVGMNISFPAGARPGAMVTSQPYRCSGELSEAVTIVLLSKKEVRTPRGQAACLVTQRLSFMLIFKFKFN